jgi:glutamate carboxypeptidase
MSAFPEAEKLRSVVESHVKGALVALERWVAISSYTLAPEDVARMAAEVAKDFADLGFAPEYVPAEDRSFGPHLFLIREGSGPTVALVAHNDTVYTREEESEHDFKWHPEGDLIYGPGTCDDKGGIAMILILLRVLREMDRPLFESVRWVIALNAAEERLARDFPERCRERFGANPLACLVFEGAGGSVESRFRVVTARKGSANLRIIAEGRSAHAGNDHHEGANAIHELALIIPAIESLTDHARRLTVNVGLISGGTAPNRVPQRAEAAVNIRAFHQAALADAVAAIHRIAAGAGKVKALSDGFPCRVIVEPLQANDPWQESESTLRLLAIWEAAAGSFGIRLESEQRGGLSDANRLCRLAPTLDGLGPSGGNDHCSVRSPDGSLMPEYVEARSFVPLAMVNVAAVHALVRDAEIS